MQTNNKQQSADPELLAGKVLPISSRSVRSLGEPLESIDDVEQLQSMVERLWSLLDDIDTASDMFKPCPQNEGSFEEFYRYAMQRQAARRAVLVSDGYNLFLPSVGDI